MPKGNPRSNEDLFWSHVTAGSEDDCWLWQGGKRGQYGSGYYNGKRESAHRVSYLVHKGAIPDGLDILHTCDSPLCVNPNHLVPGTHAQNMRDMAAKRRNRGPLGTEHHRSKLDPQKVLEILGLIDQGYSHRAIGEMFGVSGTCISKIRSGHNWWHVTGRERKPSKWLPGGSSAKGDQHG